MLSYKKYLPWEQAYPRYGKVDTYQTLQALTSERIVVLDTETTGLKKTDQITEIAIVNYNTQETLLNTMLLPQNIDASFSESKASKVSGISYEQLLLKPTFQDIYSVLLPILKGYTIAGWNIEFDIKMLVRSARYYNLRIPVVSTLDVMKLFQAWVEFSDYNSLEEALDICGIDKPEDMHRALSDVYSTMKILRYMEQAARIEVNA